MPRNLEDARDFAPLFGRRIDAGRIVRAGVQQNDLLARRVLVRQPSASVDDRERALSSRFFVRAANLQVSRQTLVIETTRLAVVVTIALNLQTYSA